MLRSLEEAAVRAGLAALGYESRDVCRLHVVQAAGRGDLPTVVLLHGLGSRAADFLPLMQRLRPHVRRVVAPDFPGHGRSDAPGVFDVASSTDALVRGLGDALDEPAVIYGNSLGGFSAIRFAGARPDRVRGLFLASPAGAPSTPDDFARFQSTLRMDTHATAVRFLETVVHDDPGAFRHLVAWAMRRRFEPVRPLVDDMPTAPGLTAEEIQSLAVPVHLLWGKSERLLPAKHLDFFRAHLRDATIDHAHGFGHAPQLDDVDALARRLVDFTRQV